MATITITRLALNAAAPLTSKIETPTELKDPRSALQLWFNEGKKFKRTRVVEVTPTLTLVVANAQVYSVERDAPLSAATPAEAAQAAVQVGKELAQATPVPKKPKSK